MPRHKFGQPLENGTENLAVEVVVPPRNPEGHVAANIRSNVRAFPEESAAVVRDALLNIAREVDRFLQEGPNSTMESRLRAMLGTPGLRGLLYTETEGRP